MTFLISALECNKKSKSICQQMMGAVKIKGVLLKEISISRFLRQEMWNISTILHYRSWTGQNGHLSWLLERFGIDSTSMANPAAKFGKTKNPETITVHPLKNALQKHHNANLRGAKTCSPLLPFPPFVKQNEATKSPK